MSWQCESPCVILTWSCIVQMDNRLCLCSRIYWYHNFSWRATPCGRNFQKENVTISKPQMKVFPSDDNHVLTVCHYQTFTWENKMTQMCWKRRQFCFIWIGPGVTMQTKQICILSIIVTLLGPLPALHLSVKLLVLLNVKMSNEHNVLACQSQSS